MPGPPASHLKVVWRHDSAEDPVLLYSELDSEGWEVRKVEVFADGRMNRADAQTDGGSTGLSVEPLPSIEDIRAQEEFEPASISAAEFGAIWRAASQQSHGRS